MPFGLRMGDPDSLYVGLIYVLVIAFLMTLFELVFFLLMIAPEEAQKIREKLWDLKQNRDQYISQSVLANKNALSAFLEANVPADQQGPLQKNVDTLTSDINALKTNLLNVETIREDQLNVKINTDAIIFIVIEMVLFLFFIYLCYIKVQSKPVWPIVILAGVTAAIFVGFQVLMYYFAGGLGNPDGFQFLTDQELQYYIYDKLKRDLFNSGLAKRDNTSAACQQHNYQ